MSRPCLICGAPFDVVHFSVEACRACAQFFKRTILSGSRLICRQGQRKCSIVRSECGGSAKFMCRSCRFNKCIEIGMEYDLPRKRGRNKKKERVCDPEESIPFTPTEDRIEIAVGVSSLLDRIEASYNEFFTRRLAKEREYMATLNLPRAPHPTKELFIASFATFSECFRMTVKESASILMKAFTEFESLPIAHRAIVFKNYLSKFGMVESAYLTAKYFEQPTHFMVSLTTCFDFENQDGWIVEVASSVNKHAIKSAVRVFSADFAFLLAPMVRDMMAEEKLTEREFYALTGLCYCDIDALELPEEIVQHAVIMRAQIFEELQNYYQNELKLNDYSTRIGNLMTIAYAVREGEFLRNEVMRTYTRLFDLNADDRLFCEFFSD